MARRDKQFCGVVQGCVSPVLWNRCPPLEYCLPVESGAIKNTSRLKPHSLFIHKVPPLYSRFCQRTFANSFLRIIRSYNHDYCYTSPMKSFQTICNSEELFQWKSECMNSQFLHQQHIHILHLLNSIKAQTILRSIPNIDPNLTSFLCSMNVYNSIFYQFGIHNRPYSHRFLKLHTEHH